jgi:putative ABC transport system permease protein
MGSMFVIVVLAWLAGIVAAVRPARRAARLDVLRAIATE